MAIGAVLGLLYLFPIFGQLITNSHLQQWASRLGPMTAGLEIQATTNLHKLPISPWAALISIDLTHPQPFCHRPSPGDQHPRRKPDRGKPSLLRH